MYRRRNNVSKKLTKQDFIYHAARFFLHEEFLNIQTQLEILANSSEYFHISNVEYASAYQNFNRIDLLTEIGYLASLLETAYNEGSKSRKYGREKVRTEIATKIEEED